MSRRSQSKLGYALLVMLFLPCSIFGAGPGTSGSSFLKIAVGARPAAMGEAFLALSDDVNGMAWNPAGLAQMNLAEMSFTHLAYFADINYEHLGYARPILGFGVGLGLTWLNVAPFNSTLDPSAIQGSASDFSLTAAGARNLGPNLMVGANIKSFVSNLSTTNSIGGAIDLGLIFKPMGRSLAFAMLAQNLGVQSQFEASADSLPINLRLGLAWRLYNSEADNVFNFLVDVNKPLDNRMQYRVGMEAWLFHSLAVRAGYKFNEAGQDFAWDDFSAPANMTAGLGLRFNAAQIDYAFVPLGELGMTHRVSASWKFGYKPNKVEKEAVLSAAPKIGSLGPGQAAGVAFNIDTQKALGSTAIKEWKIDIRDADGRIVKTITGQGPMPRNLAWDLKDESGKAVDRNRSYKFNIAMRDANGRAVATEGFIAREIKPKEMLATQPKFDTKIGSLVFQPKSSMSVGVKEWKLNIRSKDGTILKTLSGTGAIPKTLELKPQDLIANVKGVDLASGKQIQSVQYDFEFKDAAGQQKVISDSVRFHMGKAEERTYKLPIPIKEFKVNRGREILVASLPNLTASTVRDARGAPFVLPIPEGSLVRKWKFEVTAPDGRLVKTFKGDSELPENIYWDGSDENGLAVPNAERSIFSFWVVDDKNRELRSDERRSVRSPFNIQAATGRIRKISGIWFRFLDSDIQEAVLGKLREISATLRSNPNVQVTIQGHTWEEGTPEESLRLSQERADSVLRFLIEDEGVSPKNVSAIGYGDTMPLVPAEARDAADKNRRVEVVIVSK